MNQSDGQRKKLLIADDSEINRSILADILEEEFEIFEAADGTEAISMLEQHGEDISAVLLDIVMPHMNGFEVLSVMRQRDWIEDIPVIIISAESGASQIERAFDLGATDFIMRPFDALLVYRRVINTVLLYTKQKKLLGLVIDQIEEKERRSHMMVDILSHIVEFRNGESSQHVVHVRTFTEVVLRQLLRMTDQYALSQADISLISTTSALHDIGKIAIDETILNKPGRLTPEEFEKMKQHTVMGAKMLESLPAYQDSQLVKTAWEICRWHHERYDGRGYPDGLKGDDIPISAQVVALADVYDALISDRCYKKAIPHKKAIQMILNGECGTFNPLLMECLNQVEGVLSMEFGRVQVEEKEILRSTMIREVLRGEKIFASERSLRLMDQERMKYNSFSELTNETRFEYSLLNNTLQLSEHSAQKLGMEAWIADPMHNEKLIRMVGQENLQNICAQCRAARPGNSIISGEYLFEIGGKPRWYRLMLQLLWSEESEQCVGLLGKAIDIHDSRLQMDDLEKRASHDVATGLLNRSSAKERIIQQIRLAPDGQYAMAIFDLDHLKQFNDNYGHVFGSKVLKHVSEQVKQGVRGNDIVARIGGDEFLVFLRYHNEIESVIQRIFNGLVGSYEGIPISVSMGVALSMDVGNEYEAMFQAADRALYSAKRAGRGRLMFYDESMRGIFPEVSSMTDEKEEDAPNDDSGMLYGPGRGL